MRKKCSFFLIPLYIVLVLSFLFSQEKESQERGLKVVRTPEGDDITLYKGSYALVVGNGKYTAGWDALTGAEKDVDEVADCLKRNGFEVILVKNAEKNTFLSVFSDFTYKYGQDEDNQLLFYYAGHGHTELLASGEELGYLVMVDAPLPEKDLQGFDSKSVDMQDIITQAKKIKSKHVLFILDSCFSGTVLNLRERATPKAISDAVKYPVRQFITAGRANEPVPDRSIFKQLFLDLLEGKREEPIKDGYISGEELGLYLKSTVPEYNKFQHPQYGKIRDPNLDKGDFIFVLEGIKLEDNAVEPSLLPKYNLSITSFPENAKVIIDGKERGATPFEQKLGKGRYTLKIEKEGYKTKEEQLEINSDLMKKYDLEELNFGDLIISFYPYAEVEIDGKRYREVPPPLDVKLPAGKHTIRFISIKLNREKTIVVEVSKGERKRIHEKL